MTELEQIETALKKYSVSDEYSKSSDKAKEAIDGALDALSDATYFQTVTSEQTHQAGEYDAERLSSSQLGLTGRVG